MSLHDVSIRVRLRRWRYVLWAVTREDRPDRRMDGWIDTLQAMNATTAWDGLRFRAGRLVDSRGRFAAPYETAPAGPPERECVHHPAGATTQGESDE